MKQIWLITRRELQSFFDSLIAYIMIVVFLVLSGMFTWLYGSDVFFVNQASLHSFFLYSGTYNETDCRRAAWRNH